MNRFTDLEFDSITGQEKITGSKVPGWSIQFGGDLLSLNDIEGRTEFICLHLIDDRSKSYIEKVSTRLTGDLCVMPLNEAQHLCAIDSKYCPEDFFTFGGFCSWRPGQLEIEMGKDREEWRAVSIDGKAIFEALKSQSEGAKLLKSSVDNHKASSKELIQLGTSMWQKFLSITDVPATERLPSGQVTFYDHMLNIWAAESLLLADQSESEGLHTHNFQASSNNIVRPGTLLRSKIPYSNDILLYEHEFIRSLILVIEEATDVSVGVILNQVLSAGIDYIESAEPLPIRYGGPVDALMWKDKSYTDSFGTETDDEEDYSSIELIEDNIDTESVDEILTLDDIDGTYNSDVDDSPFIWIHRNKELGSLGYTNGGGKMLGTSAFWIIEETDALDALQTGMLSREEVMVFSGVCIWEKGLDLGLCGGGLREQTDTIQSLELIEPVDHNIDDIFKLLTKNQKILSKETLDLNLDACIQAWNYLTPKTQNPTDLSYHDDFNSMLADACLRAWIGVDLLGDPLGTKVVVGVQSETND